MEPGYNDPNHWIRWYAEQQELLRARQQADLEPVDQAGFEQQLGELEPRSSKDGLTEASLPDTPVGRSGDNIQHTNHAGSMLMPQGHDLRDSLFNSVDIPRASPGSSADGLGSASSSSMRYEAPLEAQFTVRTKEYSKPPGLLSRVKSGLGKVLRGRRCEKSSGDLEYVVLHSALQIDRAKRPRPSDTDQELIDKFKKVLRVANFNPFTVNDYALALRQFSGFLQSKGLVLKDVLGDPDLLTAYKDEFVKAASAHSTGRKSLSGALRTLQDFQAGKTLKAPKRVYTHGHPMHPSDEQLISQFDKAVRGYKIEPDGTRGHGTGAVPSGTIRMHVGILRQFARWLLAHKKDPLARLYTEPTSLADDVDKYFEDIGGDKGRLRMALSYLRRLGPDGQLVGIGAGPRLMGRQLFAPYREDALAIDHGKTNALSMGQERSAVATQASRLRSFGDWLQSEGKLSIVSRIDGTDQQLESLRADCAAYRKTGRQVPPLDQVREFLGFEGIRPYEEDAGLIEGLANEELNRPNPLSRQKRAAVRRTASSQREFGDWLRATGRRGIASRINGNGSCPRAWCNSVEQSRPPARSPIAL
ncbi:conserved protein of unknown function (fragment) [Bradyrhizobium sp. ORS 285]|uniref:hypothetical protein n=1 Tax=Bradyrhizobium sp. ORS 285 TaxID=115808 RepID=UPI000B413284